MNGRIVGNVVAIGGGILDEGSDCIVDSGTGAPVVINGGSKLVVNNSD